MRRCRRRDWRPGGRERSGSGAVARGSASDRRWPTWAWSSIPFQTLLSADQGLPPRTRYRRTRLSRSSPRSLRSWARSGLLRLRGFLAEPCRVLRGAVEERGRLEWLERSAGRGGCGPGEHRLEFPIAQGTEGAHGIERLREDLQAVDARDDHRSGQVHREVQAFERGDRIRLEQDTVPHALHSEDTDALPDQLRDHHLREAAKVRIEEVQWHLNRVETETVLRSNLQHVQVDVRVLVAGETDETDRPRLPRLDQ